MNVALSDSSFDAVHVRVVGGQSYLNDCSEKGIWIDPSRNVTVEGVRGIPVIDCGGAGRLFSAAAPSIPCDVNLSGSTRISGLMGRYILQKGVEHSGRPVYKKSGFGTWFLWYNEGDAWKLSDGVGANETTLAAYTRVSATTADQLESEWVSWDGSWEPDQKMTGACQLTSMAAKTAVAQQQSATLTLTSLHIINANSSTSGAALRAINCNLHVRTLRPSSLHSALFTSLLFNPPFLTPLSILFSFFSNFSCIFILVLVIFLLLCHFHFIAPLLFDFIIISFFFLLLPGSKLPV